MEQAIFGAGCFWGVEAAFRRVEGVALTEVGYAGGDFDNPTYESVCTGRTGHAEVVRVKFDPEKLNYVQLLEVFWACHDPTTLNRQGPDHGSQYRSAIFTHSTEQSQSAKTSLRALMDSGATGGREVVTEIAEAGTFYRAEEYHQQYLEKRGQSSCH